MLLRQIYDEKLAQYAYLIGCQQTGEALLIDPQRDIDRYTELAAGEGLAVVAVAETHIHADFLSGAREFAERHATRLYLSDEGDEDWKYEWVKSGKYDAVLLKDGDSFQVGNILVRAVHTPGHTPEHMSFLITDRGGGATEPMGLVSGDFVFVGDLGRPDLLETAAGQIGAMEPSARRLYASVQGFLALPDYLQVWPAHGAGSACGKALGAIPETTVGYEKRFSPALAAAARGEEAFLSYILEGQPEPPMYFARMKRDNKLGPPTLGELPRPGRLTAIELGETTARGDVLILDTRPERSAFMSRHLPGSLYAPLGRSFSTAVGSVVEDETTALVLIVPKARLREAILDLVRVGYDRIVGWADPETLDTYFATGGESAEIVEIDFPALARLRHEESAVVLDVRFASEFGAGHVPGSLQLAYTRLPMGVAELPSDRTLLVHCGSGARAAVASAYLAREGFTVRYVNDDFEAFRSLGPVAIPT